MILLTILIIVLVVVLSKSDITSAKKHTTYRTPKKYYTRSTPKNLGDAGENYVAWLLSSIGQNTVLFNDIIIKDGKGNTSQIDHIFINQHGVWVIETKNFKGYIFGTEEQQNWTQVLGFGKEKHSFYNPIKQNLTHQYRLKEKLGKNTPIIPLVVFTRADISNVVSGNVCTSNTLRSTIESETGIYWTTDQIRFYAEKIKKLKEENTITEAQHIENIHKKQERLSQGGCPRCEGMLVLRNGKNGYFYGCSNYPKCKFTKNISE